ncbi:hypothetical protein GCM10028803_15820 [Larkinella knui]|uniref:CCA tRNA nucleotidyltransferase n=1 Tax=Larkinella knui TaxID=2025310 RepID=A0A3P1C9E9_9BACT|nr:CCA tRNA nucleotidyltransferase [Larkinella knui]RRB09951.1 CCA tRNA nucleotidyltransferase [Larkinella knui]
MLKTIPEILNKLPGYSIFLKGVLTFKNQEYYIAGGAIRDLILNKSSNIKDIDIFVTQDIYDEVYFEKFVHYLNEFGKVEYGPYGSPRWFPNKGNLFYYDIVPYYKFNVGLGIENNINKILNQFDFTANAIAYDIKNNILLDPIDGIKDINNKILKAVRLDFPDSYISDKIKLSRLSALWFRFMHYSSKLNFVIEPLTLSWIKQNAHRIKELSTFEKYFFSPTINEDLLAVIEN